MSNLRKPFIALLSLVFVLAALSPANAATLSTSQERTVKALFKALASSQPATIQRAINRHVASGSSAALYSELVKNHFTSSEYLKSIDKFGNVSPTMQDPKGRYTYKNGRVTLNSYFDFADGIYLDFKFNKSGKITSWSKRDVKRGKKVSSINSVYPLTVDYFNAGTRINSGIMATNANGQAFVQLKFAREFGGLISWTLRGNYRSPDGVVHTIETTPIGCVDSGGTVYLEGLTRTSPVIAKNTAAVLVAPIETECGSRGSSRPASILFTTG